MRRPQCRADRFNLATADRESCATAIASRAQGREASGDRREAFSDPLARKLARMGRSCARPTPKPSFERYVAFINANPTWPQPRCSAAAPRARCGTTRPITQHGARLLCAPAADDRQGPLRRWRAPCSPRATANGAAALVRQAWRDEDLLADVESQVMDMLRRLAHARPITRRAWTSRLYARRHRGGTARGRAARRQPSRPSPRRARAAVISKAGNAKALLDAVPRRGAPRPRLHVRTPQWLRAATRSPKRWRCSSCTAHARRRSSIPTNGGWSGACWPASCSTSGDPQDAPIEVARDAASPTQRQLSRRAPLHRRLDRAAFPARPGDRLPRISPGSWKARTIRIALARGGYWLGRAAEALGRARAGAHLLPGGGALSDRLLRPARARAAGLADLGLVVRRRPAASSATLDSRSTSCAPPNCSMRSRSATARRRCLPTIGESGDVHGMALLGELAAKHNDARAMLLLGKPALGRGLPLDLLRLSDRRPAGLHADRAADRAGGRLFDRAAGKPLQSAGRFAAPKRWA